MSQTLPQIRDISNQFKAQLQALDAQFPNISKYPLDLSFLNAPNLQKLVNLVKFSIPVHTYQPSSLSLYQKISETYYAYVFRNSLKLKQNQNQTQSDVSLQHANNNNQQKLKSSQKPLLRTRMNYLNLARFIDSYNPQMQIHVSQQVIRQGQRFEAWQAKQVSVAPMKEISKRPKKDKNERQQTKITRQKEIKSQLVNIQIGKSINPQIMQMKKQLIKRAQSNKLHSQNQIYTQLQKVDSQVNFILNRITENHFEYFMAQLRPFAMHQIYSYILAEKIIQKVLQEHNYITLYSRLLKNLKKLSVRREDEVIKFKTIFIEKLQSSFYKLIRKRQWTDKQELYKKQLLGFSIFLGQLIHTKVISKFIFPDIFLQLMNSYIQQYRQHQNNKSFFYHEIYIECVIKIIEIMGPKYQQLLAKKTNTSIDQICSMLLKVNDSEDVNFSEICDFIEVVKEINKRLPSQRFKISFLLQDFRCSKAIIRKVDKEQNNQNEVIKEILTLDHQDFHDIMKIGQMVGKCNPNNIMKDYYFQFAQGNVKQVTKNVQTFKLFMHLPGIYDAALSSLKQNMYGLYMIDCDFPYLAQGIAKIMKQVCDSRYCQWKELALTDEDEDVMEFIERIQNKYFKMILQD